MSRSRTLLAATLAALVAAVLVEVLPTFAMEPERIVRPRNGDTNADGRRDLSDVIYHLQHLFNGGPAPQEPEAISSELAELIETRAAAILAVLPPEEISNGLPARVRRFVERYRSFLQNAQANVANWDRREVTSFTLSFEALNVSLEFVVLRLCQFFPAACIDQECMDRCRAEADACRAGCPPFTDINYLPCTIECETYFAECSLSCIRWTGLLAN